MKRYVFDGASSVLVMSSATSVSGTLAPAAGTSGGALSGGGAAGVALGVGSSGAAADADADAEAAGCAPFFFALVALCASASGATAKVSSATVAKKECRCRPSERAMENLWSARECKESG